MLAVVLSKLYKFISVLNNNKWVWLLALWYQERNTDYSHTWAELEKLCLMLRDNARSGEPEKAEDQSRSKQGIEAEANIWKNVHHKSFK